jgi:hypothetical protein
MLDSQRLNLYVENMPRNREPGREIDDLDEHDRLSQQLERFAIEHKQGRPVGTRTAIDAVVAAATNPEIQAELGLPSDVSAADVIVALDYIKDEHTTLDVCERLLIEAARDRGETWDSLGAALGKRSGQAMQQRYRRIGGRRTWPTRTHRDR